MSLIFCGVDSASLHTSRERLAQLELFKVPVKVVVCKGGRSCKVSLEIGALERWDACTRIPNEHGSLPRQLDQVSFNRGVDGHVAELKQSPASFQSAYLPCTLEQAYVIAKGLLLWLSLLLPLLLLHRLLLLWLVLPSLLQRCTNLNSCGLGWLKGVLMR